MRLEETDAVKDATYVSTDEDGVETVSRVLSSRYDDKRQSEEGQTLKAVQRICQKCERGGKPYKFPAVGDEFHMILVDFRTFLNGGEDRIHVDLGGKYLKNDFLRRYWDGKLITGVFDEETSVRGARTIRDRVHFIGFVNETEYEAGASPRITNSLPTRTYLVAKKNQWRLSPLGHYSREDTERSFAVRIVTYTDNLCGL